MFQYKIESISFHTQSPDNNFKGDHEREISLKEQWEGKTLDCDGPFDVTDHLFQVLNSVEDECGSLVSQMFVTCLQEGKDPSVGTGIVTEEMIVPPMYPDGWKFVRSVCLISNQPPRFSIDSK